MPGQYHERFLLQDGYACSLLHARGLPRKIRVKLTIADADHKPANMEDAILRYLVPPPP